MAAVVVVVFSLFLTINKTSTGALITVIEVTADKNYFTAQDELGNYKQITATPELMSKIMVNHKYFVRFNTNLLGKSVAETIEEIDPEKRVR